MTSKRNTKLIRINKKTAEELERVLPSLKWPQRIDMVNDFSMIKHKDNLGGFLYGKKSWGKFVKKTEKK